MGDDEADTASTTDGALILERANSNENHYNSATGEFVSHLRGNVVFRYEDVRLSSNEATWQRSEGIIDFRRNVKAVQRGQVLTGDRVHFERDKKLITATGNVRYQDSAKITFLRGQTAEYMTDRRECLLKGKPLLTRLDSTDVDTLFISGRLMTYNDSLKIATVTDSVRVRKGDLRARSEKGEYFADADMALMRVNPEIDYEGHKVTGDSIDLFFSSESLREAIVMGNARGRHTEAADSTRDNATTTLIWSDSLHMSMSGSGKVSAIKAFRSARGDYSEISASTGSATVTSVTSDSMYMLMTDGGKIHSMMAYGNAHGRSAEWTSPPSSKDTLRLPASAPSSPPPAPPTPSIQTTQTTQMTQMTQAVDSTITHIWSDSLRVTISESGKIRVMRAFNNMRSLSFVQGDSARANEVTGRLLTLSFNPGGRIERAVVRGGARSVYFVDESDGGGCNRAGGELIVVLFSRGKAQRILSRGGARGIYSPSD